MKALILNCSLKPSPEPSNSAALAKVVADALRDKDVEVTEVRLVDHEIKPGVETDVGEGDEWPSIHDSVLAAEILVVATPTWIARPSSVAHGPDGPLRTALEVLPEGTGMDLSHHLVSAAPPRRRSESCRAERRVRH